VLSFRLASNSRKFDRERGVWIEGDRLRVRVVCWRRQGENPSTSVQLGDAVIVEGRLYRRDRVDHQGARRTRDGLDAVAVGHDLARGVDTFVWWRAVGSTEMVDDEAAATLEGERTEPVEDPDGLPPDHGWSEDFDPALWSPVRGPTADGRRW
jgi:single-strand DNA-binding protein